MRKAQDTVGEHGVGGLGRMCGVYVLCSVFITVGEHGVGGLGRMCGVYVLCSVFITVGEHGVGGLGRNGSGPPNAVKLCA